MNKIFTLLVLLAACANFSYAQWIEQASGTSSALYSVSAVDNNNAWICAELGKVIKTTNGGANWLDAAGTGIPGTIDLYNIFAIDSANALVTGSSDISTFVYKTTNGGTTWTQVFTQSNGFMDAIYMTTPLTGIMYGDPVGGRWSLWKTINGGTTWDSTGMYLPQNGAEAGWNNAMFVSGTNVWFGTDNSRIYHSVNNGLTWTSGSTIDANSYSIWLNTPLTGLAGGSVIMQTSNGGTNWSAGTTPAISGDIVGLTGVGTNYWMVGGDQNIFMSSNGGANWTSVHSSPFGSYTDITVARTGTGLWAIADDGTISKGTATVGIAPISGEIPSSYKLSQNYPNPFNPATNIEFAVPVNSLVKLTVYDALGKEVSTLVNEVKPAGNYKVDFNASNLNSGVYFYTLEGNGFKQTKKMLIIK